MKLALLHVETFADHIYHAVILRLLELHYVGHRCSHTVEPSAGPEIRLAKPWSAPIHLEVMDISKRPGLNLTNPSSGLAF